MKTFRWKVKPDMEVNSQPSVREVRFGDGYSQRMAAGLNADLKTYRVTLSVTREEARHLEAFLAEHGFFFRLEGIFVEATLCIPADKGDLCRVVCAGRDVAR
ncbi:Minor tail protein M [Escherichia coli SHECO002]|nr:Minor tail protein M [Escherichia coli SHECO002]